MPKKKSTPPKLEAPGVTAAVHLVALAEGKRSYRVADDAMKVLVAKVKIGRVIELPAKAELPGGLTLPEELRGKKVRLRSKGHFFSVGQTARGVELEVTQP